MTSDVEALRGLSAGGPGVTAQLMTVASVRDDGLVNLEWGGTLFPGIPADASYAPRRAGDVVLVLKHDSGWRVLPPTGAPVQVGDAKTTATRWGEGAPGGSGWQKATDVWVRDGEVYAQLAGAPTVPPTAPTNSPKVTIKPNGDANYSQGHRKHTVNGGHPVQGGYRSYPNNRGLWLYGSQIASACSGKTVRSMSLKLTRRASGGRSGGVRPRLYVHDYPTAPYSTPSLSDGWSTGQALGWGEGGDYNIPAGQMAALASGSAKGFGCQAPNGNNGYMLFTAGSGVLTIVFD